MKNLVKKIPFSLFFTFIFLFMIFTNCEKEDESLPIVTTSSAQSITSMSAEVGGEVVEEGGSAVTERGIVWSTTSQPTTNDNKISWGTGTGSFTLTIDGLDPEVTYYYKAYAINQYGTAYGDEAQFTTLEMTIDPPEVTTDTDVTEITFGSARAGGEVTSDGGGTVSERGLVWSTEAGPTIDDNELSLGQDLGTFTGEMTRLMPNTVYFVRAYATNEAGISYGDDVSFTTEEYVAETLTDIDGNEYKVVPLILDGVVVAEYMAENLVTTSFDNGDPIGFYDTFESFHEAAPDPAYSIYPHEDVEGIDSQEEMVEAYGIIYNWHAVDDAAGLCPDGWSVPTSADYIEIRDYFADGDQHIAGSYLKSTRTEPDDHPRWDLPNDDALDEIGWAGLPGGRINASGTSYSALGSAGRWWCSDTNDEGRPRMRRLYNDQARFAQLVTDPPAGMNVRCFRRFQDIKTEVLKKSTLEVEEEDTE